jgi:hypothetical protein
MNTRWLDSNHYETDMNSIEDEIDPHNTVRGIPDDRLNNEDPEFEVMEELSCPSMHFSE